MPKGHPRYGGRQKGTPNKTKTPLKERADALGVDPFEVLLLFAKGDWKALGYESEKRRIYSKDIVNEEHYIQPAIRAKAAAEACQYIYPKLKAIEHSGDPDKPVHLETQLIILPDNGRLSKDG